eukprot:5679536-Karenia_brevis.AAC.1
MQTLTNSRLHKLEFQHSSVVAQIENLLRSVDKTFTKGMTAAMGIVDQHFKELEERITALD